MYQANIIFALPRPQCLNEVWGAMSIERYEWLQRHPPVKWRWWAYWLCPFVSHPYAVYANRDDSSLTKAP